MFVGIASHTLPLAALAVVLLAGCTADPVAPAPSPSPVAEFQPITQPQQVFGGDCGLLLSDDEARGILGPMPPVSSRAELVLPVDLAVENAGGLSCQWGGLLLDLVPAGAVDPIADRVSCGPSDGQLGGAYRCDLAATVDGVVLSGVLTFEVEPADAMGAAQAVIDLFTARAASGAIAARSEPGAWPIPLDCAAADLDALAAEFGDAPSIEIVQLGGDAYRTPVQAALEGSAYLAGCAYGNPALTVEQKNAGVVGYVAITALGGGAWAYDRLDDGLPVEVPGFDAAVLVESGDWYYLNLFSGPNWMQTSGSTDDFRSLYSALSIIAGSL